MLFYWVNVLFVFILSDEKIAMGLENDQMSQKVHEMSAKIT